MAQLASLKKSAELKIEKIPPMGEKTKQLYCCMKVHT